MGGLPDMLFVIDTNKEEIAVQEANKLRHPGRGGARQQLRSAQGIAFPIPGNDDAIRADQRSTAIWSRAPCSTASRPRWRRRASTSASIEDLGEIEELPDVEADVRRPPSEAAGPAPGAAERRPIADAQWS